MASRRGLQRGVIFLWMAHLPNPLPVRSSRGEEASLMQPFEGFIAERLMPIDTARPGNGNATCYNMSALNSLPDDGYGRAPHLKIILKTHNTPLSRPHMKV